MGSPTLTILAKAGELGKAKVQRGAFQEMQIGFKPGGAKTIGQPGNNLIRFFKEKCHHFGEIRRPDFVAQCVHSAPVDHGPYRPRRPLPAIPHSTCRDGFNNW